MQSPQIVRASTPSNADDAELGPLVELPGSWKGTGFNLIALPVADPSIKFRVKLNAYHETLTFSPIGGPIPNRGNFQNDINMFGLHYLQSVDDLNGEGPLFLEPGL